MIKKLAALALLLISACSDGDSSALPSWVRESGSVVDSGTFGEATANNIGIQNGDKSYVLSLATRFAEEVPAMVNFDFDSAVLDENARTILRQQAAWIREFPEVRFKVYGHTDAVGSNAYNKSLGMRRARAVVSYLSSQGIGRDRLEAVVSLGKTQPLVVTQNRERRNRRTVTEVTGFVSNHPNILDGRYASVIYREYVASAVPPTNISGLSISSGGE
ncbi:OmpA family protein [Shimia sp.]|jgi:outer membrane protein OmpA-like peptidoglycan-associated protein|uniref:OmpA family protein n=1 Tax=unclassified Shimia TaxID=2630038 RepID=UPI0025E10C23|nr:OmpA family protein [Shimia sp.]MCH2065845.1 OmpA family protein [Shimia sp.]